MNHSALDSLFDSFALDPSGAVQPLAGGAFEVVGRPGGAPTTRPREGDIVIRRALGEGRLSHLMILTESALPDHPDEIAAESTHPGWYARTVDWTGAGEGRRRRVLGREGRVPHYQLILRLSDAAASPDDVARQLRAALGQESAEFLGAASLPLLFAETPPWQIDSTYYTDRGGAVSQGRKLQQSHTSIQVFRRSDKNWQVRYRYPVPTAPGGKYPFTDTLYYKREGGAKHRARTLRAYGYVVTVFQRTADKNWQCRVTRLSGSKPRLPTATGADKGFIYTAKSSAKRRAKALKTVGFRVKVIQRATDKNWQVEILALPTFRSVAGKPAKPAPAKPAPAKPAPAKPAPAKPGAAPPNKLVKITKTSGSMHKLNDAVLQSFRDFAKDVKTLTGVAIDSSFGDVLRHLGKPVTKKHADHFSWHKTGRAVDLDQGLSWRIRKEPSGSDMYFRLYLRHKNYKTAAAAAPRVVKFAKGTTFYSFKGTGRRANSKWAYVDVTEIARSHGWHRIRAHSSWKTVWDAQEWWHYEKRGGLSYYAALRQVYTEATIVTELKKKLAKANKHGGRLKREGFPDSVLKQMFTQVKKGNVSLYAPVGDGKKAANISDDVKAVQTALIKDGLLAAGSANGVMTAATKKAIKDFQTKKGATKPDGRVDVGGTTHGQLGAL